MYIPLFQVDKIVLFVTYDTLENKFMSIVLEADNNYWFVILTYNMHLK